MINIYLGRYSIDLLPLLQEHAKLGFSGAGAISSPLYYTLKWYFDAFTLKWSHLLGAVLFWRVYHQRDGNIGGGSLIKNNQGLILATVSFSLSLSLPCFMKLSFHRLTEHAHDLSPFYVLLKNLHTQNFETTAKISNLLRPKVLFLMSDCMYVVVIVIVVRTQGWYNNYLTNFVQIFTKPFHKTLFLHKLHKFVWLKTKIMYLLESAVY